MNLNKTFLIGRLTQDPETRATPSGQNVTTLRMATNRVWNDNTGQRREVVEYHTIIAWARLGDIASKYLRKGGLAMIEGRLQTRSWTGQDNVKRYVTEIIAEGLQLGPKSGAGAGPVSQDSTFSSNIKKEPSQPSQPPETDNIPIIDENEPTVSAVEEDEVSIKDKDLPF